MNEKPSGEKTNGDKNVSGRNIYVEMISSYLRTTYAVICPYCEQSIGEVPKDKKDTGRDNPLCPKPPRFTEQKIFLLIRDHECEEEKDG